MSATLGFNSIPYYSWKDQVFYQVSSFISENKNNSQTLGINQLMKPMPLKIYRREIASVAPSTSCSSRISYSINELYQPGSTIISNTIPSRNGLVNIIDNPVTECKSTSCNINMPDVDARRRVRSAGMIRKKYNPEKNNDSYCSDSNQYLVSRNRTFSQNQYHFIRQGNGSVKPGSSLSNDNLYSPNGISHCIQPYISSANNNNLFQYVWIDNVIYNVTIPDGQYDIVKLNQMFQNAMVQNNTYFISSQTSNQFLFQFTYDSANNKVVLDISPCSDIIDLSTKLFKPGYSAYEPSTWYDHVTHIVDVSNSSPYVIIPVSNFKNIIGFSPGSYNASTQQSNITPFITSNYVKMNYKPNNSQFGVQGAVSGSNLILRKKYDTITDGGAKMKAAYGSATASALAYGVSDQQYTLKQKMGYPITQTPVICKYTGQVGSINSSSRKKAV
jgi:hypothetical protein